MPETNEAKPKTSKYIIANGNGGMFRQFIPLLKGKWGFGFALIAWAYALAYLPVEQTDNLLRFLPFLKSIPGIIIIAIIGIIIMAQTILKPIIDTATDCFDRYLTKEEQHIKIMGGIEESIKDLEHILKDEFILLLRQQLEQSQKNYKGIKMIWEHINKGGINGK